MNDFQQTYPNMTSGYPQQLAPQGLFGGLIGGPLGGMIGRGIGGMFGNANLGSQIGQVAGGIGGSLLPFQADPMMAAYAQQQAMQSQLAPQGFFGNLLGQVGQPLGGAIGGMFGNAGLGSQIGNMAGQIGRMLPFQADPMMAAYAQQQAMQSQLAPQGFFGNLLGQVGQPLGSAIGGIWGQSGLGGQIGNVAGQIGRMLPFGVDPMMAALAQQQASAYPGYQGGQGTQLGGMPNTGYGSSQQTLH